MVENKKMTHETIQNWQQRIDHHQKNLQTFNQVKCETLNSLNVLDGACDLPFPQDRLSDLCTMIATIKAAQKVRFSMIETAISGEHEPINHLFDLNQKNIFDKENEQLFIESVQQKIIQLNESLKSITLQIMVVLVGNHFYLAIGALA